MRICISILLMLTCSLLINCSDSSRGPEAMISVRVIGEQKEIINDAIVKVGF